MSSYKSTKEDRFTINLVGCIFILILLLILMFNLFNIADYFIKKGLPSVKPNDKIAAGGQFGDIVGGVIGTVFAIASTLLLIYTLARQQTNFKKERFESRFFELIKIYRDTVDEMNIGNHVHGRKCFLSMYKEFKELYLLCLKVYVEHNLTIYSAVPGEYKGLYKNLEEKEISVKYRDGEICRFAYKIFFSGIGLNSELYLEGGGKINLPFFKLVKNRIEQYQQDYGDFFEKQEGINETDEGFVKHEFIPDFSDPATNEYFSRLSSKAFEQRMVPDPHGILEGNSLKYVMQKSKFPVSYYPFDGHISRLGHYYRTLFQIVRYVVSFENDLFERNEIYEYLKILRTQMSNHEQILLYYNVITGSGSKWQCDSKNGDANYLVDYKMIHNVPFPLAEFGIDIKDAFSLERKNNPDLFEWDWADSE